MCAASGKDGGLVGVRVAVPAEMEAGVVGPDVGREVAGASGAPRCRSRGIEAPSDGPFIVCDEGAAGAVGANGGKFGSLRARLYRHAVRSRDFDNGPAERQTVCGGDFSRFREIFPHLRVEVDEAYHHGVGGTFEGFGHFGEGAQVVFGRVAASEQNRVIAPAYRIAPDNPRKASENLQESVLVGDVWLDVAPVGGDCHKPELAVRVEPVHVFEHRGGVLGAEADGVNDGRIKAVAPHLARVVWVPDADEALVQPAREPLRVEGGDVGSLARVDDHGPSGGGGASRLRQRSCGDIAHLVAAGVEFGVGGLTVKRRVEREEEHAALGAEALLLARRMPPLAKAFWGKHDPLPASLGDRVAAFLFKRAHECAHASAARPDARA